MFVDDFVAPATKRNDPVGMSFDNFEVRSFVTISMFRDNTWIGNIDLDRRVVDPFDPKVGPVLQTRYGVMSDTLTPFQIDAVLRRLARPQLGLVTVTQAAPAGLARWALERRREVGSLLPVFSEVRRLACAPITPEQRILAAALAMPGSTVTATSVAIVHGLPVGSATGTGRHRHDPPADRLAEQTMALSAGRHA